MGGGHDFSSGNRARIAVVIVLATLSYWLAVVLATIVAALTLVLGILLNAGDFTTDLDVWRLIGIGLLVVIAIAAVVGTLIALVSIPSRRRALEDRMLWESGAELVEPDQYPEVRNLLAGLAIAADIPQPRFVIVHDAAPNSFGVGTKPAMTVIGITTGLMKVLTRDELEAVLAYEVSRIGSWDVALSSWTVALTSSAIEAVDDEKEDSTFLRIVGFMPRATSQRLQVFAMRGQARERDRIAIAFTRHPLALIRALEKLHADRTEVGRVTRATAPLWLEYPVGIVASNRSARLLAEELSLDGRIERIREMAGVPRG
jgi:heat shock protein HtpX